MIFRLFVAGLRSEVPRCAAWVRVMFLFGQIPVLFWQAQ